MNYLRSQHPFLLLLCFAAFIGCGNETVTISSNKGDFIKNLNGVATGNVAGIKLNVSGHSTSAAVSHSVNRVNDANGVSGSDRWDVSIGEVKFELACENDGPISLTMGGKEYGTLVKDDELSIDESGTVHVNGVERPAQ